MNWGKLTVLIFCCITVVPMAFLIVCALAYTADDGRFENTVLGKLINLKD